MIFFKQIKMVLKGQYPGVVLTGCLENIKRKVIVLMSKRVVISLFAILVTLTLLISACGDDNTATPTTGSGNSVPTTALATMAQMTMDPTMMSGGKGSVMAIPTPNGACASYDTTKTET